MFLKASAFKQKIPEERKKEMVKPRESSELWANVENAAVFLAVFSYFTTGGPGNQQGQLQLATSGN